jgi:glc operon protein GlcG
MKTRLIAAIIVMVSLASLGFSQMPNPYGPPISIDTAKKIAAAAIAEAQANKWNMAVAIVDGGGNLVYFEKMNDTQIASIDIAIAKAKAAALFKRPTKAHQDALAAGNTLLLKVPGAMPVEGGIPLLVDGKIIGAIGASGGTSAQDGVCATAGATALK